MRWLTRVVAALLLVALLEGKALAHGIGGRLDLPVPVSYFLIGVGGVLVVSFVALSVLWPEPRFQGPIGYEETWARKRPGGWLAALGVVALLLVVGQLFPPLFGLETDPSRPTIAPVLVWVFFWLVIPFVGVVFGSWYTDLNPWRAISRRLGIGRLERVGITERVGVWPAAIVLFGFTWLELVHIEGSSPIVLGIAAVAYSTYLFTAVGFVGRETAMVSFDAFTSYNRIISSVSPLGRDQNGRIRWRGWLAAMPHLPAWRGLPALVCVAIGTVTFDGISGTLWYRLTFDAFGRSTVGRSFLLGASVLVIGLAYWLASLVAAKVGGGEWTANQVANRFAHTLIPIAVAYAVAHYVTLVLFEGQQIISAVSDPFGLGWDLFGTAERKIDFFLTATEPIWYFQVGVIAVGHVLGVVLAHDRALVDFGINAVRSQYAMLALMVGLTSLGLLILSG